MTKTSVEHQHVVKHFSIDARAMLTWGRDSIKDHTTAVLELVKNSYDAGATIVQISLVVDQGEDSYIKISDDGIGMTEEDIDNKWLRIGYSEKRNNTSIKGRRKTGEKGVGRISADRLGSILELRSQAEGSVAVGLRVDWKLFEKSGGEIQNVNVEVIESPVIEIPTPSEFDSAQGLYNDAPPPAINSAKITGTELVIRNLRQKWSKGDVDDLRNSLSVLTSPLDGEANFQIRISENSGFSGKVISSPFYKSAQIEAIFRYDKDQGINFEISERGELGRLELAENGIIKWDNFIHRSNNISSRDLFMDHRPEGPIKVHLLFYLRDSSATAFSDFTVADLRRFLDIQAGVKVYRDNIRVMPYGDPRKPEGDWLGLGQRKTTDPAGAARPTFKISPNQIVGHVYLTRDFNPGISDTSGREGLIHGEDFIALRSFIYGCIVRLENYYHRQFLKRRASPQEAPSPRETVQAFSADLQSLKHGLEEVESELPAEVTKVTAKLRSQLTETMQKVSVLRRSIEQLASQATIYRGLATLGIAVATFGHEIESSLEQFMASAHTASQLLQADPPLMNLAITEIGKAINSGNKIGAWGAYALRRVHADKRVVSTFNIDEVLAELLAELQPAFTAAGINIRAEFERISISSFLMDIESIFINLLTNAYFFTLQSNSPREIAINVAASTRGSQTGFLLSVVDSGPGVSNDIMLNIWEPLFTTKIDKDGKSAGTGLGLSIIDAAVKDMGGSRRVEKDDSLGGAKFTIEIMSQK